MFLEQSDDYEWLIRLPMIKSSFLCMRAVREFLEQKKIAELKQWVVTGKSKRGWTTWLIGATNCSKCEKVIGIVPEAPIVPSLTEEVHRMKQDYGAFTFAFEPYTYYDI